MKARTLFVSMLLVSSSKAFSGEMYCSTVDIEDDPTYNLSYEDKNNKRTVKKISYSVCIEGLNCKKYSYDKVISSPYGKAPLGKHIGYSSKGPGIIFSLDGYQSG